LEVVTGLIDILNLHCGQWRNISIKASVDILKHFSSSTEPKQLAGLELAAPIGSPMPKIMTKSKLNLTHLMLTNFPCMSINVRWDHITYATLSKITIDEGLNFLR